MLITDIRHAEELLGAGAPADICGVLRACVREDFASFCEAMFPVLAPGRTLQWNWHLEAMCSALESVARGETTRQLIELPPRSLKSIVTSVMFPAWLLGRRPATRIICASYSLGLGIKLHNDCRAVMRSPQYRELFPDSALGAGKDSETELVTAQRGGRYVSSPDGTLTGRGGDIILLDDILSAKEAYSTHKREATNDWLRHTALSRLDDKRTGAIVVCCQRLHVGDLPGALREAGGWAILSLPAIAQLDQLVAVGRNRLRQFRTGELLHPEREPHSVLEQLQKEMGSATFSAQYLQRPIPVDGELVKWGWFRRYDDIPNSHDRRVYQSWDVAISTGDTADCSVGTTWVQNGSDYYLVDVDRSRSDFPSLLRRVRRLAIQWDARAILIEEDGLGKGFIQQFNAQSEGQVRAIACRAEGSKATRLIDVSPMIEAGHVYLPNRAPWLDELRRELAEFPNGRHDDQIDSITQFLKWQRTRSTSTVRLVTLRGR